MATDSNNTPSLRQKKADRSLIVTMAIVTMVVAVVAIIGFCLMDKPEEFIEGQVEEHKHTHLRKASGACGRILC